MSRAIWFNTETPDGEPRRVALLVSHIMSVAPCSAYSVDRKSGSIYDRPKITEVQMSTGLVYRVLQSADEIVALLNAAAAAAERDGTS